MITAPSTNSKFTVTFQGDAGSGGHWNAYTASRSMLRIHREDQQTMSVVEITYSPLPNKTLYYYTDPKGDLEIPLQDFVRLNEAGGSLALAIYMKELNGTLVDNLLPTLDIFNGISYYDLWAPRGKDENFGVTSLLQYVVMPPNVIINPEGTNDQGVIVESNYHTVAATATWAYLDSGVSTAITPSGTRSNQIVVPKAADTLRLTNSGDTKEWKLIKPGLCADYVVCRWTSQTGAVRQHYFPIVSYINGVDEAVSLVSAGNGYKVSKDWYKGCRCRLTGLTAYGFWYYMDIARASDLHAIILKTYSIFSTEIASAETAAYCEASNLETPQGNGFYNFEFTLKLRHYDSI